MRILIIEDDETTARELAQELGNHGFSVDQAADGPSGLALAASGAYDAITLDRMLPGLDGLSIIQRLRAQGVSTPVLLLSALGNVDDRVAGLRAGGDDYLTKPFVSEEVAARLEALIRRRQAPADSTRLSYRDLDIDLISRVARRQQVDLHLSPTEFRLLECLMRNSDRIVTRTMLFEAVWGYHFDPGTNLIEVHVRRLRRKVDGPDQEALINTVRGAGYVLGQAD